MARYTLELSIIQLTGEALNTEDKLEELVLEEVLAMFEYLSI